MSARFCSHRDAHGWIPVTTELPQVCEVVFVWPEPCDTVMTAYLRSEGYWEFSEYEHNFGWNIERLRKPPTHWRPMFQPPVELPKEQG